MDVKDIVSRDPEVVSGAVVFTRTRVPVQALVDYLWAGRPLDEFPGVKREQAVACLEMAHNAAQHALTA